MSRRRRISPMELMHSQRALTEMAGERVAEMMSWRAADTLGFAIVVWSREPDGKATTYTSTNDAELAVKLSALIGEHTAGGD